MTSATRAAFAPSLDEAHEAILTPDAMAFVAELHRQFDGRRRELLARRVETQHRLDGGVDPDFPTETREIRDAEWRVAPIPSDLEDRRVEITGPVDRKMVINALNSGANVYMADFEDANAPTWRNVLDGQVNLRDAVNRSIRFTAPDGREYRLVERPAVLFVRPRGWHLPERHCVVDGTPVAGALLDFGLFFYHNARALIERGTGPYFYLPKLENRFEARLWHDLFVAAEDALGISPGTIRATVLIENVLAAFEMDEILWELRDYSAGLNCGRWDYIFSFIKKFRQRPGFVLPDRAQVTMDRHFLASYVALLIQTCHRRGIHAMGGMAAQIPIKSDPVANARALDRVRDDKLREVRAGHDGTWVAHPGLVPVAKAVFDEAMPTPNQIDRARPPVTIAAADLLKVPSGTITEAGLRQNVDVGLRYLASWLTGIGCVPLYNLMEDAATAEISRSQVWQWVRHGAQLDGGAEITVTRVRDLLTAELDRLRAELGGPAFTAGRYIDAAGILEDLMTHRKFIEWLTLTAYDALD